MDGEDERGRNMKYLALKVSVITVAVNLVLSVFKFTAGILAHSGAMISDAIHSASDVLSTLAVMVGVVLADKKADECHPYGHDRIECVVSVVLAVCLALTGAGIGGAGIRAALGLSGSVEAPGRLALTAAVISIGVKEWMYWYTRSAAKKAKSAALMADAWHHRSDALSSLGALLGIAGARAGYPILDPVAGVVICLFIEKAALDIFRGAMRQMVDRSGPRELSRQLYELILQQSGVGTVCDLKTRQFASKVYVDVEIGVDGQLDVNHACRIAGQVHDEVERRFEDVKHCSVQVRSVEEKPDLDKTDEELDGK